MPPTELDLRIEQAVPAAETPYLAVLAAREFLRRPRNTRERGDALLENGNTQHTPATSLANGSLITPAAP